MQPDTYRMLADRQDHYWWHRARRNLATALLQRYGAISGGNWVDVGCGPGGNLCLAKAFKAKLSIGVDFSPLAIELAKAKIRDASLLRADISLSLPLSTGSCDTVTIFNVLYHEWVADEETVLREVQRILRPGGLLLMTEPAFSVLRREMDVVAMGRRRYRKSDLQALCRKAGMQVLVSNYFTSFGFPLLLGLNVTRQLRRLRHSEFIASDMRPIKPIINKMLYSVAMAEAHAIEHGIRMPFGSTTVCLARKPH